MHPYHHQWWLQKNIIEYVKCWRLGTSWTINDVIQHYIVYSVSNILQLSLKKAKVKAELFINDTDKMNIVYLSFRDSIIHTGIILLSVSWMLVERGGGGYRDISNKTFNLFLTELWVVFCFSSLADVCKMVPLSSTQGYWEVCSKTLFDCYMLMGKDRKMNIM